MTDNIKIEIPSGKIELVCYVLSRGADACCSDESDRNYIYNLIDKLEKIL